MPYDVPLRVVQAGIDHQHSGFISAGILTIRQVALSATLYEGSRCLEIEVETRPPVQQGLTATTRSSAGDLPLLTWLSLEASVRTTQVPARPVGRVIIQDGAMVGVSAQVSPVGRWLWEILPEHVDLVEQVRSHNPASPLVFGLEIGPIREQHPYRTHVAFGNGLK